jgi:hypothetical protein
MSHYCAEFDLSLVDPYDEKKDEFSEKMNMLTADTSGISENNLSDVVLFFENFVDNQQKQHWKSTDNDSLMRHKVETMEFLVDLYEKEELEHKEVCSALHEENTRLKSELEKLRENGETRDTSNLEDNMDKNLGELEESDIGVDANKTSNDGDGGIIENGEAVGDSNEDDEGSQATTFATPNNADGDGSGNGDVTEEGRCFCRCFCSCRR